MKDTIDTENFTRLHLDSSSSEGHEQLLRCIRIKVAGNVSGIISSGSQCIDCHCRKQRDGHRGQRRPHDDGKKKKTSV